MVVLKHFAAIAVLPLLAVPALAGSLTTSQVGTIFCFARLAGDMAPVEAILTPELAELLSHVPAEDVRWQGKPDYANTCQPVGASGTAEAPESVLSYGYREEGKSGFSDRLVLRFVDGMLRLDDIRFADDTTLRQALGTP